MSSSSQRSQLFSVSQKNCTFFVSSITKLCQKWIDFNDSFTVVTKKLLYTNMELNLPPHISYVAALPCTQHIMHVKPLTFCTNKHQTLFRRTCGIQISQLWTQSITRSGLSCKVVSTIQKSVVWMNGGWSTCGVALNSRLSTWLLTTSVEDFECASIRKEDH